MTKKKTALWKTKKISLQTICTSFVPEIKLLPAAIHVAIQRSYKLLQGARYRNYLKDIRFKINLDNKFWSNMTWKNLLKNLARGWNKGDVTINMKRYVIHQFLLNAMNQKTIFDLNKEHFNFTCEHCLPPT